MSRVEAADPGRDIGAVLGVPLPAPCVLVMMGPSGAGKSTAARQAAAAIDAAVFSYDECRKELVGDPHEQSAMAAAVRLAHQRAAARCALGQSTVVDGTHTQRDRRLVLVDLAAAHGLPAVLVVLLTPLQDCLARQHEREPRRPGQLWGTRVADEVVRAQHAAVLAAVPGLHAEGWRQVHLLDITEGR